MILLHIILSYILFFLATLGSFYIPGRAILEMFGKKLTVSARYILAWVVGYSLFIFLSYIGAWIHIPYLPFAGVVGGIIYFFLKRKTFFSSLRMHLPWIIIAFILFGSIAFTSLSFLSGLVTERGFQFIGSDNGTDAIMHVARIKTQVYAFPPIYTGFAGYQMHGYHYFYDFLLSRFILFYHFSAEDLYYRLFPFFISLLYGASLYLFSTLFTKKMLEKTLILFFAYFGASFGYILSFLTLKVNPGTGLGLVQQIELILDPSVIFSAGILLGGFYILLQKKTLSQAVFVGSIIGLLAQLKIYAGIIGLGTLLLYSIYLFYRQREWRYSITANSIAIILTAVTYLPNNFGVGHLIWAPFFLYENLLKQPLFDQFHLEMRMFLYKEHHNISRIWMMNILGFVLFWILALGSRIAFLFAFPKIFHRRFWNDEHIVLGIALCIPIILGSFFIQSILLFDTVQFFWMLAILISIPAGIFYGQIYAILPKYGKYLLLILLIFFSFGEFYYNEDFYVFHPHYTAVRKENLHVIQTIMKQVHMSEFFVIAPAYSINRFGEKQFLYYPAPLFASLTGRQTYYEYEIPEFPDAHQVDTRKNRMQEITLAGESCDEEKILQEMKKIGSRYLLSELDYPCSFQHVQKVTTHNHWTYWLVK